MAYRAGVSPPDVRHPIALFVFGLLLHAIWGTTIPIPEDWDAQYYLVVARSITQGDGPVTQSLWTLGVLPQSLPLTADLHWMPLPSRVLVPGLMAWPEHGAQLVTVLLAATWGPLAWATARKARATPSTALGAGMLAALGGGWARLASTPDCYALYGAIGGAAFLAAAHRSWRWTALFAALAGLCRGDGFLLGLALMVAFKRRDGLLVAAAGLGAAAAWALRCYLVAGEDYVTARALAANIATYVQLYEGVAEPLDIAHRFQLALQATPQVIEAWLFPGMAVLTPFAVAEILRRRHTERWVIAVALAAFALPVIAVLLAPVVAAHGSLARSATAVAPAHCALATIGLVRLGRKAAAMRGYPSRFVPTVVGGAFAVIALGVGAMRAAAPDPLAPKRCHPVAHLPAGPPVFTSEPLALEAQCGRAGVMITSTTHPNRAAAIALRYGVTHAVTLDVMDEGSLTDADVPRVLPGWTKVGPHLWQRPD